MAGSMLTCTPSWYLECWDRLSINSGSQYLVDGGLIGDGVSQLTSGHPHGWVNVDVFALLAPGMLG